jgi:cell division protein FtsQ
LLGLPLAIGGSLLGLFAGTPASGEGKSGLWLGRLDGIARAAGFGIDTVVLSGHRYTADSDLYDALSLSESRSLVTFDPARVRLRLEKLPWVASAEITRVYPDRLDIRVAERRPFAVWRRSDGEVLIDAGGRVLSPINRSTGLGLPHVTGEGAASEARALFDLLARYPSIGPRVLESRRVGARRWSLVLAGGVTVHLPASGEEAALELLSTDPDLARLLGAGNCLIDLRVAGRIGIRQAGPGPDA